MWAAQALKFGYRWKVGDGFKIRFWEDTWFGTAPLAVQFWNLFCICNQIGKTLAEIWDEVELKLTFRRTFFESLLLRWQELEEIVRGVNYNSDGDALIWVYESKGTYSTQSLYAVINFRGVIPVYTPAVWKVMVPPRIQFFLWLLANNKLMTIDNLKGRGIIKPPECMFCSEHETIHHLFFECVVAKYIWRLMFAFSGLHVHNYLATRWLG